jgi:hypothetical protein
MLAALSLTYSCQAKADGGNNKIGYAIAAGGAAFGAGIIAAVLCSNNGNDTTTNPVLVPTSIVVTSGSGQSVVHGVDFPFPLTATVYDQFGNALSGIDVVFTAPSGSVPSCLFSNNTNTKTVTTVNNGEASSEKVTANSLPTSGSADYTVTATVQGTELSVNFSLTNIGGA